MKKRTPIDEVILGEIKKVLDPDGIARKHFVPRSRNHLIAVYDRLPIGKEIGMIPVEEVNLRSRSQLAYHRVLVRYIAHDQGLTEDDVHDAMMKEAFGTRQYTLNGKEYEGRYSMSDTGGLKVLQVIDLITKDLETCNFLGIIVPTKKELGYDDEPKGYLGAEPLNIKYEEHTPTSFED